MIHSFVRACGCKCLVFYICLVIYLFNFAYVTGFTSSCFACQEKIQNIEIDRNRERAQRRGRVSHFRRTEPSKAIRPQLSNIRRISKSKKGEERDFLSVCIPWCIHVWKKKMSDNKYRHSFMLSFSKYFFYHFIYDFFLSIEGSRLRRNWLLFHEEIIRNKRSHPTN